VTARGRRNKKKQRSEEGRGMLPLEEELKRRESLTRMGSPEADESCTRTKEEEGEAPE
jgi:hypothetical protein